MKIIRMTDIIPAGGSSSRFEGMHFGASISCFIVRSASGSGADKHRHPYDETFVILEGVIEAIVNDELHRIESGHLLVIPANTWHEFKNRSDKPLLMVNIHPVAQMIQEDWDFASG
jgi:quercetin dioxygenase-like cupin family protein